VRRPVSTHFGRVVSSFDRSKSEWLAYSAAMSERSIYLRDEAAKCRRHAERMTDDEVRAKLQKLAAKYAVQAAEIESKEQAS
jgi:hypothetical protein